MSKGELWGTDRESLRNSLLWGEEREKKQKRNIEILHQRRGERRGSFEPVACQSFSVFLCEEMTESSLFLLHATSLQSLGKAWCTGWRKKKREKKLSLWTLKAEREERNLPRFWTSTTATYTTAAPQQLHGYKNMKSNNLGVHAAHLRGGTAAGFHSSFEIYCPLLFSALAAVNFSSCVVYATRSPSHPARRLPSTCKTLSHCRSLSLGSLKTLSCTLMDSNPNGLVKIVPRTE